LEPRPGILASTMVNHNNTWWRHIKELNKWLSTIASRLHKARSTADFIVYTSLADTRCRKNRDYRPSSVGLLQAQLGSLPETIWQAGYDFDLCNDILSKMRLQDDRSSSQDCLIPPYSPARTIHQPRVCRPPCQTDPLGCHRILHRTATGSMSCLAPRISRCTGVSFVR